MLNVSNFSQAPVNAKVTGRKKCACLTFTCGNCGSCCRLHNGKECKKACSCTCRNVQHTPTELGAGSLKFVPCISTEATLVRMHVHYSGLVVAPYMAIALYRTLKEEISLVSFFFTQHIFCLPEESGTVIIARKQSTRKNIQWYDILIHFSRFPGNEEFSEQIMFRVFRLW